MHDPGLHPTLHGSRTMKQLQLGGSLSPTGQPSPALKPGWGQCQLLGHSGSFPFDCPRSVGHEMGHRVGLQALLSANHGQTLTPLMEAF